MMMIKIPLLILLPFLYRDSLNQSVQLHKHHSFMISKLAEEKAKEQEYLYRVHPNQDERTDKGDTVVLHHHTLPPIQSSKRIKITTQEGCFLIMFLTIIRHLMIHLLILESFSISKLFIINCVSSRSMLIPNKHYCYYYYFQSRAHQESI